MSSSKVFGKIQITWQCPHCDDEQTDDGEGCRELQCVCCHRMVLVVDGRMMCRCPECTPDHDHAGRKLMPL
jgi:hypothetical protein